MPVRPGGTAKPALCERCGLNPSYLRVKAPGRVPFQADLCMDCHAAWCLYKATKELRYRARKYGFSEFDFGFGRSR